MLMFLGAFAFLCADASASEWLTDLPTAMARAQKENKAVLLDFTGSDWCGWCKKLDKEIEKKSATNELLEWTLIYLDVDKARGAAESLKIGPIPALRVL